MTVLDTNLLVLVGEEELEYVAATNNRVPAHPAHPPLQPFHTHLDKLLLEAPYSDKHSSSRFQTFTFAQVVCWSEGLALTCYLLVWQRRDGDGRPVFVQEPFIQPIEVLVSVIDRSVGGLQTDQRLI